MRCAVNIESVVRHQSSVHSECTIVALDIYIYIQIGAQLVLVYMSVALVCICLHRGLP